MTSTVAQLLDCPNGVHQLIPWKWLTSNSRNTIEILLKYTYGFAEDFPQGFTIHQLSCIELNDVKTIRYLHYRQVKAAISEIQKIVESNQYLDLPNVNEINRGEKTFSKKSYAIFDDLIRKASSIEDLAEAILDRLDAETPMSARDKAVICLRADWYTSLPQTLDAIGREYGLTRERIRQISKKYEEPLKDFYGELRFAKELSKFALQANSLENLQELAKQNYLTSGEVLDLSQCFAIMKFLPESKGWEGIVEKLRSLENQDQELLDASRRISKYRGKMGFIDAGYASKELDLPLDITLIAIREKYPRSITSRNLVLARTDNLVSTFESAIAKQLLVCDGLAARDLLIGARRHATLRNDAMSGEESDYLNIIHSLAGNPPSIDKFLENQLYATELSESDNWLITMFNSSSNGLLHRVELTKFGIDSGMNLGSITAYCGSSPFIRMHSNGVYSLIGVHPTSDQVSTHAELALSQDGAVDISFNFSESNIMLILKPNLNTYASGVLLPNREIKELFAESIFTPWCSCGPIESKQVLKLSKEGFWQGFQSIFSHALQIHEYGTSSIFKIFFDFDQNKAILHT